MGLSENTVVPMVPPISAIEWGFLSDSQMDFFGTLAMFWDATTKTYHMLVS
jgi:hypothetical protein